MLWADTETFSELDLPKVGAYNYAPTAELLLLPYAIDDGPVKLWQPHLQPDMPKDLELELDNLSEKVIFHNAQFDMLIFEHVLGIGLSLERIRCTMVRALLHGFPAGLHELGEALGLEASAAKLSTGRALINRFCKPAPSNHKARRYGPESHPTEWQEFCDYAVRDVEAMRTIAKKLPNWNSGANAWAEWRLDQKINRRGFLVDMELVRAGAENADAEKNRLNAECAEITKGEVERPSQREKLMAFLNREYGLGLTDTTSETFKDLLNDDKLDPVAARLMWISIQANKSSTSKYAALEPAVSPDGRFRGGLQFSGAARTRRWAGRLFQPHNLPSRGLPPQADTDDYIEALKTGTADMLFDDTMPLASAALRGVVIAPPKRKLHIADLRNIEGRAVAWFAGEEWKLEAFREFDRGEGPDLYKVAAGRILGIKPEDVSKKDRDGIGKISELSLGFAGGVGAIQKFAPGQMAELWGTISGSVRPEILERAEYNAEQDWALDMVDRVGRIEWLASEAVKLAWRDRHPAIYGLWASCQDAAASAIRKKGRTFRAGMRLFFTVVEHAGEEYLKMRLPSGYSLTYYKPRIRQMHERGDEISYMGHLQITGGGKHWMRVPTYGGKFVENACQSIARDVLMVGAQAADKAGYELVLSVHDELIAEYEDAENADALATIMSTNPDWADGLPLAAAGFTDVRYRKA